MQKLTIQWIPKLIPNHAKRAQSQTPSRDPPGVDFGVIFASRLSCSWAPFGTILDAKIDQNMPLASNSLKIVGILEKSSVLEGLWAGRPKPQEIDKNKPLIFKIEWLEFKQNYAF